MTLEIHFPLDNFRALILAREDFYDNLQGFI